MDAHEAALMAWHLGASLVVPIHHSYGRSRPGPKRRHLTPSSSSIPTGGSAGREKHSFPPSAKRSTWLGEGRTPWQNVCQWRSYEDSASKPWRRLARVPATPPRCRCDRHMGDVFPRHRRAAKLPELSAGRRREPPQQARSSSRRRYLDSGRWTLRHGQVGCCTPDTTPTWQPPRQVWMTSTSAFGRQLLPPRVATTSESGSRRALSSSSPAIRVLDLKTHLVSTTR